MLDLPWCVKLIIGLVVVTLWLQLSYIHTLKQEVDYYERQLIDHGIHDHILDHTISPLDPMP